MSLVILEPTASPGQASNQKVLYVYLPTYDSLHSSLSHKKFPSTYLFRRMAGTWLTVAHEIGHNFGAYHTMATGGIMSYDAITIKEYKFTGTNPSEVGKVLNESLLAYVLSDSRSSHPFINDVLTD